MTHWLYGNIPIKTIHNREQWSVTIVMQHFHIKQSIKLHSAIDHFVVGQSVPVANGEMSTRSEAQEQLRITYWDTFVDV